jgi:hypothetical protein
LQVKIIWSNWIPVFKIYQCYVPSTCIDGRQARNRKKGDEIKKKSSPLKLLSQSQPNFAEMILGWSPSKKMGVLHIILKVGHPKIISTQNF